MGPRRHRTAGRAVGTQSIDGVLRQGHGLRGPTRRSRARRTTLPRPERRAEAQAQAQERHGQRDAAPTPEVTAAPADVVDGDREMVLVEGGGHLPRQRVRPVRPDEVEVDALVRGLTSLVTSGRSGSRRGVVSSSLSGSLGSSRGGSSSSATQTGQGPPEVRGDRPLGHRQGLCRLFGAQPQDEPTGDHFALPGRQAGDEGAQVVRRNDLRHGVPDVRAETLRCMVEEDLTAPLAPPGDTKVEGGPQHPPRRRGMSAEVDHRAHARANASATRSSASRGFAPAASTARRHLSRVAS